MKLSPSPLLFPCLSVDIRIFGRKDVSCCSRKHTPSNHLTSTSVATAHLKRLPSLYPACLAVTCLGGWSSKLTRGKRPSFFPSRPPALHTSSTIESRPNHKVSALTLPIHLEINSFNTHLLLCSLQILLLSYTILLINGIVLGYTHLSTPDQTFIIAFKSPRHRHESIKLMLSQPPFHFRIMVLPLLNHIPTSLSPFRV